MNTWVFHGRARRRNGRRTPNPYPSGGFECKDGLVNELAIRGSEWKRFLLVLGDGTIPEWSRNPRYADRRQNSIKYSEELDELQRPWLMSHTRAEIFSIARANRLPFAPVYRIDETADTEHLHARDYFADLPMPDGTQAQAPGAPYVFSDTPWALRAGAPPMSEVRSLGDAPAFAATSAGQALERGTAEGGARRARPSRHECRSPAFGSSTCRP